MRTLIPLCLISLDLWAGLVWCFVAFRMMIGTDHIHLSLQSLGGWLLGIDLILSFAVMWLDWFSRPTSV